MTFGNTANLTDTLVNGDKGADAITLTLQAGEGGVATNSTVQGGVGSDTINAALQHLPFSCWRKRSRHNFRGSNQDTINGGTGADSIQGNAGVDQLSGGDGNDNFVYAATTDLFAAANSDCLTSLMAALESTPLPLTMAALKYHYCSYQYLHQRYLHPEDSGIWSLDEVITVTPVIKLRMSDSIRLICLQTHS